MADPFTLIGALLLKKVLLKGAVSLSAAALRELSESHGFQEFMGQIAEEFGTQAAKDALNNLPEFIEDVGDAMEYIADYLG
jgi:hypothetical protein